jgi:glutamyl-tRNA synthetase
MGVTEVVRGDDLLPATPPQILIARALGLEPPAFCHVPLVVGPDGRRLAKRHGDTRIESFRAGGATPEMVIGWIAATCGWDDKNRPTSLAGLIGRFSLETIPHDAVVWRGALT